MTKQYPVFVYGSLLKGLHNHIVLGDNKSLIGNGKITNFGMWSINDSYPAILPVPNSNICGEVYQIGSNSYDRILKDLDRLEGNGFLYQRELIDVKMNDGEIIRAWVYVYLRKEGISYCTSVNGGDWRDYYKRKREIQGVR